METMKRAVVTGPRKMELIDIPVPAPREDWVLVKVRVIPLCTDYKNWLAGKPYDGHEAAGEVVAVAREGADSQVKVGDRVAVMPGSPCGQCALCLSGDYLHCQHWYDYAAFTGQDTRGDTHVQYLLKQDWMLAPIPDDVTMEMGALACCGLGPTFGALERLDAGVFDTVLITGVGPVGLGGVLNAKFRGSRVIAVDMEPYRLDLARELGADLALCAADPETPRRILEFTGGLGADVALEVSGTEGGAHTCLNGLRRFGRMAFIGEQGDITLNVARDLLRKGMTVIGQWHYNRLGVPRIMDVIRRAPNVDKLITHRFPMSRIDEAMAVCAGHQCGKVLVDPWA